MSWSAPTRTTHALSVHHDLSLFRHHLPASSSPLLNPHTLPLSLHIHHPTQTFRCRIHVTQRLLLTSPGFQTLGTEPEQLQSGRVVDSRGDGSTNSKLVVVHRRHRRCRLSTPRNRVESVPNEGKIVCDEGDEATERPTLQFKNRISTPQGEGAQPVPSSLLQSHSRNTSSHKNTHAP